MKLQRHTWQPQKKTADLALWPASCVVGDKSPDLATSKEAGNDPRGHIVHDMYDGMIYKKIELTLGIYLEILQLQQNQLLSTKLFKLNSDGLVLHVVFLLLTLLLSGLAGPLALHFRRIQHRSYTGNVTVRIVGINFELTKL